MAPANPAQHRQSVALDGVYVREGDDGPLVFHALPEPSQDEVAELARRVAVPVAKLIARRGRSLDPEGNYDSSSAAPPCGWTAFDESFPANLQFEALGVPAD